MNVACILAGGRGTRMQGAGAPKQFRPLLGKPVLLWSMAAFDACEDIDLLCIVADHSRQMDIRTWAKDACLRTPLCFALPGEQRTDSAFSALSALKDRCRDGDVLLFHDAARPLVSTHIIRDNIRLAGEYDGVYTAVPSQDSVFVSHNGQRLARILPRRTLWCGQTPQSFRYEVIRKAHALYRGMQNPPPVTDDCSLVHLMGGRIGICRGEKRNMKITTLEDLHFLEVLLSLSAPDGTEGESGATL